MELATVQLCRRVNITVFNLWVMLNALYKNFQPLQTPYSLLPLRWSTAILRWWHYSAVRRPTIACRLSDVPSRQNWLALSNPKAFQRASWL
jgi:hypothetical protein